MKQFATVEDYLEIISGYRDVISGRLNSTIFFFSPIINLARYDNNVLDSMSQAAMAKTALTERQGELAIKIVVKYKKQLALRLVDISPMEKDPKFRVTPRKMDYRRSLTIRNDTLIVRFPFDTTLIDPIRVFKKDSQGTCGFNTIEKEWEFGLTEHNLNWIHTLAQSHRFEIDPAVAILVDKLHGTEQTQFKIELYVDGDKLSVSNCPSGMREYINTTLGGFDLSNLEKLADHSGELGYTIHDELATALEQQYGKFFLKIAQIKEAKLQHITQDRFEEILNYALNVRRSPIVIYEPNQTGQLRDMLLAADLHANIQMIDHKYSKGSHSSMSIDSNAQIVYTVNTIRTLNYIPLLISTAGMIYGSDKQIMFQNAGKVLYLTPDVYRGKSKNPQPTVENLDI